MIPPPLDASFSARLRPTGEGLTGGRRVGPTGLTLPAFLFSLLPLVLPPTPAHSQARVPDFGIEWRWADYDRNTGFQGGTVREMVEAGDTLWTRTDRQIYWWAGFEWVPMGPAEGIPGGRTTSIVPALDGGVWAVVDGRLYRGGTGGFEGYRIPELESEGWEILRAAPSAAGVLMTARGPGLAVFLLDGEEVHNVTPGTGLAQNHGLWGMPSGAIFLNTGDGLLRFGGGVWEPHGPTGGDVHQVSALWEEPGGDGFFFQTAPIEERGLWSWDGDEPPLLIGSEGGNAVLSGASTGDGLDLVIYETGDLRISSGGEWTTLELPAARSHGLHLVFADNQGNLWFASARGLHLYRTSLIRWTTIRRPFPDLRNRINDLLSLENGGVLAATGNGLLLLPGGGPGEWIGEIQGNPLGTVTGLTRDSVGNLWISSGESFEGAYRQEDGRWARFGPEEGLDAGLIHRMTVSGDGAVWFLSLGGLIRDERSGVYRLNGGRVERWLDPADFLRDRAYAFGEGRDGSLWFGTGKGIARWKEGEWRTWGPEEGVGSGNYTRVFTILPDSTGGAWFGYGPATQLGLGRLAPDGSVTHFTVEDGLPGNAVNDITKDADGVIWVSTDHGLGRFAQGSWTVFDGSTGLDPVRVWPIEVVDDGLLIGTVGGGIKKLNRREEENPPPSVRLLGPVSVQGRSVRVAWRAVAYQGEINPTQVLTRDRFDGGEWSSWAVFRDLWTTEDDALSWGRHRIEIQAKGLYGQLSEPLVAEFTIPYPVYLRAIFLVPVGSLALILGVLLGTIRQRRRRSARLIEASEERLRALVDSAPEALVIFNVDADRWVDGNENAMKMLGITREEAVEYKLGSFSPEKQPDGSDSRKKAQEFVAQALEGEEPVFEWSIRTGSGQTVPTEIRLVSLPSEGQRLVRFSILDIRERRAEERHRAELEDQLRQSQKLEAVGQLTGGVAHDFNNLLTVIMGNLELLKASESENPATAEYVERSLDAAERSALLTQRLLAFSRRQALDVRPLSISSLVGGMMDLLARSLGEIIEVRSHFQPDLWMAMADKGQLEHALINLAVNARDAMPTGGQLRIRGSNAAVDADMAEALDLEAGDYVSLSVSDTGVGMEPEVLARVFDPFFTTKEVGKGSGLGLSMVYGFVKQLGGSVRIESARGAGTTIHLYFPSGESEERASESRVEATSMPRGSGERLLVVEDDPGLLDLTALLCQRLGYNTIKAPDGPAALTVLKGDAAIDLLFTDVVLPGGLNGVELAKAARELRPDIRVLFTSGYADQSILDPVRSDPDFVMVRKPFDRSTLAQKLEKVLRED